MAATQPYGSHPHHAYMDGQHPHSSSSAAPYPHYQQPAPLQPAIASYALAPNGHYQYAYPNALTSTQHHQPSHYSQQQQPMAQLPAMQQVSSNIPATPAQGYTQHTPDTTGQIAPPGSRPKITATLWEDEGTLCFQVEVNGICVARREDNHMINGTKLLNVANMTRGRRDGILKSEKVRSVVKIGPMHLKGVWIPFERALDFANKEKITEQLYPLFVHNVGALLHHPQNATVPARRGDSQGQSYARTPQHTQPPPLQHHHSVANPIGAHAAQPPHSIAPNPLSGRPGIERSYTFPTPPASATSMMGMGNSGSSYEWAGPASNSLGMETNLGHARSMPTTPATTPPEQSLQNLHQQYHTSQPYDNARQLYVAPPPQQTNGDYNQPAQSQAYGKNDMPPPVRDGKDEDGDAKAEYIQSGSYSNERGYPYNHHPASVHAEHTYVSPETKDSPSQRPGSARATPRSANTPQNQWHVGYGTPQRSQPLPSNGLPYVVNDARVPPANGATNGYHPAPTNLQPYNYSNGGASAKKRGREIETGDQDLQVSGDLADSTKRRKMVREGNGFKSTTPR